MDNKTKISLFFDLQIITNKDGEPIYMDFVKQSEEGDTMISEELYPEIIGTLLKTKNKDRRYVCPVMQYYSYLENSMRSINKQYENDVYNRIIKDNMSTIVSKAVADLDTLDKHIINIPKEIYTISIEIELEGTGISSLKCNLFSPTGKKECDLLEKALFFLYMYYKEINRDNISKSITYLLCFSVDNDDINTANIFNIFTGDLGFIFDYKKTEDEEDDSYLDDLSENYIDNFLDVIIGGLNKLYYGDFIDETYRVNKLLN